MREDYLRLLERFASEALPPASEDMDSSTFSVKHPAETPPTLVARISTVWTWNAAHQNTLALIAGPMSLDEVLMCQDDIWEERVQQVALLVKRDPQVVLVQAVFRFNRFYSASTFAAVRYSPNAPQRQRYSIVSSVFRLGQRQADLDLVHSLRNGDYLHD